MSKRFILYLYFICFIPQHYFSQNTAQFDEVSLNQGIYLQYDFTYWGQGVSFFDFDEDGWDDLTLCQTNGPVILYRNNQGYFEPHFYFFAGNQAISSCWGDLDNDGKNDLIISTYDNGIRIFKNVDMMIFEDVTSQSSIMNQSDEKYMGIALGDINRDGLLEIAVANYSDLGKNLYLLNTGNFQFQTLVDNMGYLNVQKFAFQPCFIDLNKDLWPDIYMINDFYAGNEFYWNNGDFNISENDTTFGLFVKADAMSNSWKDYDRDGDLDLYVTNRYFGNYFMQQNDDAHFQNIIHSTGTNVPEWCWSATWIDAENNGFMDLLVTKNSNDIITDTSGNHFFQNQGNGHFIEDTLNIIFPTNSFASALGDFNNDGLSDVANSTRQGYNFELYQNTTITSGNHFKFRLEGHLGNRNGIGTHYDIWTNNRRHYGYTQAGENYIAQNSQNQIIGLGENSVIDSIILRWPSGIIDKHYNLIANELHVLHEAQDPIWWSISDTILCGLGDTVWIESSTLLNATWWDNTHENSKFITQPGTYTFNLTAPFGQSKNFTVVVHNPQDFVSIASQNNICNTEANGSIVVQDTYNNQELYNATQLISADYPIQIEILNCIIDTIIPILSNEIWTWDLPDTLWACDTTSLNWNYWDNISENSLLGVSNVSINSTYSTTWQNIQGCQRDTLIQIYFPEAPVIGTSSTFITPIWNCELSIEGEEGPYNTTGLDWNNGLLNIRNPGIYPFQVIDRWGCSYSDTLQIDPINSIVFATTNTENWRYQNPYLIGPKHEKISVYNSVGQLIQTTEDNEKWILPDHSAPRWVMVQGKFYPISWVLDK
jgi:hypothetical protein